MKETINSMNNLQKKKKETIPFLWGFREYFEGKFPCLADEKVMINSLSSIISLRADLSDFVYLIFKNMSDKVIQKSLRIYLKNISEDPESILNLCEHLCYWKERNFTKTGSDTEKFSLDYLILRQLETSFEDLDLDKSLLQKLT